MNSYLLWSHKRLTRENIRVNLASSEHRELNEHINICCDSMDAE